MTAVVKSQSRYDQRVALVQNVVSTTTSLGEQAAFDLAVSVLRAIDHIPEKVR